jgi:hypothetical protein
MGLADRRPKRTRVAGRDVIRLIATDGNRGNASYGSIELYPRNGGRLARC